MVRNDSKPPQARRSDAAWNIAAVAGLLCIGIVVGGVAGVVLDRSGLLGSHGPDSGTPSLTDQAADATPAQERGEARLAPVPADGRPPAAWEDAVDREALEAAFQRAAEEEPAARAEEQADVDERAALPPAFSSDRSLTEPAAWQLHAVATAPDAGRPMVAIVLDDIGVNRRNARRAIALPGPLTLAFMTYAEGLPDMTAAARAAGHELMLHVPMQPRNPDIDPGPNVLAEGLPAAELAQRLAWGLDRFEGYVGINNHMGSRFTASPEGMAMVMAELKARGLLFLDSLTAKESVAGSLARRAGVPFAERDVFLDNEPKNRLAIERQLALLEQVARDRGYAVGIGHPHPATVEALAAWIPEMRARGFVLVPISAVVRHRLAVAGRRSGDG
ncbi:divergent polysaccharide deacetylase family protein [Pelagibius sp.]|uniref:divergent polysaccharide deacetylase family protein n=1 Tax=Pelagibius sp. TaxID=1931238 RepID=UPI002603D1C0|nr:divergent polysaccharide deacetylase family protein [Pelagibius sp.]